MDSWELLQPGLIGIVDLIDILVVGFLIYRILLLIRGTRGMQVTIGIIFLALLYYASRLAQLKTVEWILANFLTYIVFAIIVIYQAEIRRGLANIGRSRILRRFSREAKKETFEEIVLAATTLASRKIGGLIVLEGEIGLKNYVESGIKLEAMLTYDLLVTIFSPQTPLHDGAVIIQENRIAAAACFLPLTLDPYLSKELGTRHRAAIGITEETDAIAIVISEETGRISAVMGGKITRNLDGPSLLRFLHQAAETRHHVPFRPQERQQTA
ncbi:MAG: TIGR00159 family protein [Acidobacteria bacterium]|nr:TIGR00159 family protein [Acidobacteriota bacterium]